ncbi:MAG TPA: SurA N-terminal domain-containing protein [Oscillospiraceae bacterium]|nr:SurA N-terminal domain-containing protein [Oscillospiraceae bacterium]
MSQKHNMKFTLGLLLTLLLLLSGCRGRQVVAEVNGDTIKRAELDDYKNVLSFLMPDLAPMLNEAKDRQALEEIILQTLIENKLLVQLAAEREIAITDEELTAAVEQQAETISTMSGVDDLTQPREELNITDDQLKAFIAGTLYIEKLIAKITPELEPKEIDDFQSEQPTAGVMLALSQILVQTESEAEIVRTRLLAGEELAIVAQFLPAPTALIKQGELGCVPAATTAYPESFMTAANQLAAGEISAPVQTGLGWHIIVRHERQVPTKEEAAAFLARERLVTIFDEYYQRAEIKLR